MDKIKKIRGEEVAEGCGVGSHLLVCDVIGRYDICEVLPVVACVCSATYQIFLNIFLVYRSLTVTLSLNPNPITDPNPKNKKTKRHLNKVQHRIYI